MLAQGVSDPTVPSHLSLSLLLLLLLPPPPYLSQNAGRCGMCSLRVCLTLMVAGRYVTCLWCFAPTVTCILLLLVLLLLYRAVRDMLAQGVSDPYCLLLEPGDFANNLVVFGAYCHLLVNAAVAVAAAAAAAIFSFRAVRDVLVRKCLTPTQ
jgi:hypothetical protein